MWSITASSCKMLWPPGLYGARLLRLAQSRGRENKVGAEALRAKYVVVVAKDMASDDVKLDDVDELRVFGWLLFGAQRAEIEKSFNPGLANGKSGAPAAGAAGPKTRKGKSARDAVLTAPA